ncbi:TetR family transcriptional regulator [Nocardia sp. NPDC051463]|uniref:TetR/AcrR family transcriptional regulator n=1 Tax=Nocardia sp. NPDC051463 TaxID=3154845 RepID=UPI00344D4947
MPTNDRRTLIVDAAIDLIATRGIRALTHRALDAALDLPAGSASYYFRTKRTLIEAIADRIMSRSRTDFHAARFDDVQPAGAPPPGAQSFTPQLDDQRSAAREVAPIDPPDIARAIATWLDRLLVERRNHLIVRHALLIDLLSDAELHPRLAHSLFSVEHARNLFRAKDVPDPETAAADFIAVIEGAVFDRFAGARTQLPPGTPESIDQLTALLLPYLIGNRLPAS